MVLFEVISEDDKLTEAVENADGNQLYSVCKCDGSVGRLSSPN